MNKYYFKRKPKEAQNEKKEQKTKTKRTPQKKKSNLVDKLDKVFSAYIRLRDTMPSGYFKCISCGQIKAFEQADCGHFFSRRHHSVRFDEDDCHAECRHCLTPDALVLTSDLRWVELGDLRVGDRLLSFEEERSRAQARLWKEGIVTHTHREIQDVYDVELENGDHIKTTPDHKWLARKRCGGSYTWVKTKDLWVNGYNIQGQRKSGPHTDKTCSVVCKPFEVVFQDLSSDSGWLAGMIDADGHLCQQNIRNPDGSLRYGLRVGVAQCDKYPKIQEKLIRLIERFTQNNKPCRQSMDKSRNPLLNSNYHSWQFLVTGTNVEKLHFLMRVRPLKIDKLNIDKLGMIRSRYDSKVKKIKYIGKEEIVVLETSTHTFIANGYAMHNCNRFSSDHLIAYQANLIRKIGMQRFELLTAKSHQVKKWSDFELEAMIEYYKREAKRLSSLKGIRVNI